MESLLKRREAAAASVIDAKKCPNVGGLGPKASQPHLPSTDIAQSASHRAFLDDLRQDKKKEYWPVINEKVEATFLEKAHLPVDGCVARDWGDGSFRQGRRHHEENELVHERVCKLTHQTCSPGEAWVPEPLHGYTAILQHYRNTRRTLPHPHHSLTRHQETTVRQIQSNTLPIPVHYSNMYPDIYSPLCQVCGGWATITQIIWQCPQTLLKTDNSGRLQS